MRNLLRGVVLVVGINLIVGCGTMPISQSEAGKYTSPQEFVEGNFVSWSDRAISNIPGNKLDTGLMSDKSVMWRASFNKMNRLQLFKPVVDTARYCKAAGGALVQIADPDSPLARRILTGYGPDVQAAAAQTYVDVKSLGYSEQTSQTAGIAAGIVQSTYSSEAIDGVKDAIQKKALGKMSCDANGTSLWMISITPVKLYAGNTRANALDTPDALLNIRVDH
jgi:hypothetical protein